MILEQLYSNAAELKDHYLTAEGAEIATALGACMDYYKQTKREVREATDNPQMALKVWQMYEKARDNGMPDLHVAGKVSMFEVSEMVATMRALGVTFFTLPRDNAERAEQFASTGGCRCLGRSKMHKADGTVTVVLCFEMLP